MRINVLCIIVVAVAALSITGCPKPPGKPVAIGETPDYERPLPPGQLALRKITDPRDIPDFTSALQYDGGLKRAIDNSLHYLAKSSSKKYFPYGDITHQQAVDSLTEFSRLLAVNWTPAQKNQYIRQKFDVYTSVGWNGKGGVKFTGYYTPIFDASPTRTEKFRYPIFKAPAGMTKDEEGNILGVKQPDGTMMKLPARKEIEQRNMMAGNELYWLADPFEVYIVHVQGSAKLRMADGRLVTVGYTANNGFEYKSVAREMVADGLIDKSNLSLTTMIEYFRKHPQQVAEYTARNPRFVFFAESGDDPHGSLNEPVITLRSIATDKSIYPRACLAFLSSQLPRRLSDGFETMNYAGFALDQDTGGAIRAAGRCDIYMGIGDKAGELAGHTQKEGRLYYLFLKPAGAAAADLAPTSMPAVPPMQAVPSTPSAAPKPVNPK